MDNWNGIISLFIACIELVLIINILIFAEKSVTVRLGTIFIILLFLYQVMEFVICGMGLQSSLAAYLAFADISLVPPVSVLFVLAFTGRSLKHSWVFFIPAVLFIIYYALVVTEFKVVSCTVFYASYNYPFGSLYGFFYYLLVIFSMIILYFYRKKETTNKKKILTSVLLTGYLIPSIPVLLAFILSISGEKFLLSIIESVMCKFAFFISLAVSVACVSYPKKQ